MNIRNRLILEDFKKNRPDYIELDNIAHTILQNALTASKIPVMAIQHRVKTYDSLSGKLERDSDRFSQLCDITDLFGGRIICYFADDIDLIGELVQKTFVIDQERSSDRRQSIKADTFGYVSLHYICSLPPSSEYRSELCNIRFEIQIRTLLQHTWAEIEHDFGYKTSFGIPRKVRREFSRVAGLLEIADDEFTRIRRGVTDYTESICQKIADNKADDISLDSISLREYTRLNHNMKEFISKLADFCHADIEEVASDSYLEQLNWLGKENLGDLQHMLDANEALALKLAERALKGSELDILSSSVGLWYLCRAELLAKNYSSEQIMEFIKLSMRDEKRAAQQAEHLLHSYREMMQKGDI